MNEQGREASTMPDVVEYGENGLRRTFTGRDVEAAGSDFSSDDWSLGASALGRRSMGIGFGESYACGKSYGLSDILGMPTLSAKNVVQSVFPPDEYEK